MAEAAAGPSLPLPPDRDVGSIAGNLNWGLGWVLGLPRPNDTLVAVEETQRSDMRDTGVLAVSHGSMLLSRGVVDCIHAFLRTGAFAGDAEPNAGLQDEAAAPRR